MDYTLAVLTHGDMRSLGRTLASFFDKVKPIPKRVLIHRDGAKLGAFMPADFPAPCEFHMTGEQRGFCKATAALWHWASAPGEPGVADLPPFVFWLEHDFTFLRPVDLADLARVLDGDKSLAQMQLMRNPVSREEIASGGLFEMRRDAYERRFRNIDAASGTDPCWLQHRAYFTTNPSLMRTDFMTWNHWPDDDEPFCEGRFGIELVQRGFSFGVWGSGEPWVEHVGHRDPRGFGY